MRSKCSHPQPTASFSNLMFNSTKASTHSICHITAGPVRLYSIVSLYSAANQVTARSPAPTSTPRSVIGHHDYWPWNDAGQSRHIGSTADDHILHPKRKLQLLTALPEPSVHSFWLMHGKIKPETKCCLDVVLPYDSVYLDLA